MTTEQLAALKKVISGTTTGSRQVVVSDTAVSVYATDENCLVYRVKLDPAKRTRDRQIADAWFHAKLNPTTCLELLEEVERLRNQWNTRFNTLCGNCGNRYLGPRDEHMHGIGKCGSVEEGTTYMQMFTNTNVGDD